MLRNDSAEYISEDEVMIMRPLLPDFYNASYSWNTHAGCSNTLFFTGKHLSTALRLSTLVLGITKGSSSWGGGRETKADMDKDPR